MVAVHKIETFDVLILASGNIIYVVCNLARDRVRALKRRRKKNVATILFSISG